VAAPQDASSLLSELTLEEKASLCLGSDFWHAAGAPRLGIPALRVSDGPHGLRRQPDEGSQVGIGGSLPATCFPTASALGSSFDPDLARRVGQAIGREAHSQGIAIVLGPGINIKRSPLCGRNFEYLSEDPVLSGVLGGALVEGLQSQGIGASLKHFAVNNQETDRMRVSADIDERSMREIYFAGFERAIAEAKPWTVMCSYNKVNGVYASENHWLLTEVLRQEWGFDGIVVSDWGAVHNRVASLLAGLDLEMPPHLGVSDAALVAAVRRGELDEGALDISVVRLLALRDRVVAANPSPAPAVDLDAHHELARAAARECAVLLKNDRDVLPLRLTATSKVAVIGQFAQEPRFQGGGSSKVNPTRVDVALDQLRAAMPEGAQVTFAAGYGIGTTSDDEQLAAEAVALAAAAQSVVVFLGLPEAEESEGFDRSHIHLPANQVELLPALAAANPDIVVVLVNGSVVQVSDWEQHAAAILECWLAGQAGGGAIADLLTGAANPSGRMAETLPLRLEDNSSYLNFPGEDAHVRYGEGIFVGYRAYDKLGQPVSYPFGHGLSYTEFSYSDLRVEQTGSHAAGDLAIGVSFTVANSGRRQGKEVPQLYVSDLSSTVARPVRELKSFAKIDLAPGQSTTVTFSLRARDLSFWSLPLKDWALEAGQFELSVGASSRDLRLTQVVDVAAPDLRRPVDHMSSLQEWLADPEAAAALRAAAATDETGQLKEFLDNQELITVVGSFPISTVAAFAGMIIDSETINQVLAGNG
jgi:beta-glucosidase